MARNIDIKPIVYCENLGERTILPQVKFSLPTYRNFWQSGYFYEMLTMEAADWVKRENPFNIFEDMGMPVDFVFKSLHYTNDREGGMRDLDLTAMPPFHTIVKPYVGHGYVIKIDFEMTAAQRQLMAPVLDQYTSEIYSRLC